MKRRLMIQKIGGHVMAVKLFEQQFCQNPEKRIIKSTKDKKKYRQDQGGMQMNIAAWKTSVRQKQN